MIREFRCEYRFLSNFWKFDTPMIYDNMRFITNEHFYVAMKTKDRGLRETISKHPLKGLKKFGRSFPIREDWEDIKFAVMLYGVRYKFSKHNPNLRMLLLETGDEQLQEGNWWGDKIWGICLKTGEGANHLGRILMQVREEERIINAKHTL